MHSMFNENAELEKFLRLFPSLLGSRSQLVLNRTYLDPRHKTDDMNLDSSVSCTAYF